MTKEPEPKFNVGDRVLITNHGDVGTITSIEVDREFVDHMSMSSGAVSKFLVNVDIKYTVRFFEDKSGYREGVFKEKYLELQPELPFFDGDEDKSAFTIWLEERK